MGKFKVVITDYQYENLDQEKAVISTLEGAELFDYHCKSEEEVIAVCKDADAIIDQYAPITRRVIDSLEKCKIIVRYGIGVDTIDVDAATEKGIFVANVPDYGIDEVSNHAISMIMALARKLPIITKALKGGDWGYTSTKPLHRMEGATLGLVGLGRIPSVVAKKMSNFGMNIISFDPYADKKRAEELHVKLVSFEELLKESDFISIHCPATEQTKHMFDDKAFSMMKKTAFLINTARGTIIDTDALITALENGEIAGAGLDVFEKEPIDFDSKLLKMDNVIATPHFAWYSEEAITTLQRKVAEEVVNVLKGNAPFNLINKKLLIEQ